MARDYKSEYQNFHARPEEIKKRAKRNAARAILEKEGRVSKGDGKDVDHKVRLKHGGGNGRGNLRVSKPGPNRSRNS